MLRIGASGNNRNPATGAPEFGVMDWLKKQIQPRQVPAPPPLPSYAPADQGINSPETLAPNHDDLRFDPNGTGERQHAFKYWASAIPAAIAAYRANTGTVARYGKNADEVPGESDAYKHALWSYRMAEALGPEVAKSFTDAHEVSNPNAPGEHLQDLYNNRVGREAQANAPKNADAEAVIQELMRTGQLRIKPF